ncbi:uncharacterized protein KZ484_013006 [Pholidichthys leucotaenia]
MSTARKELIWSIRGRLFALSSKDLFGLTKSLAAGDKDTQLSEDDNESCMDYVSSYLRSPTLLKLEDEGMSQLLMLDDLLTEVIQTSGSTTHPADQAATPTKSSPHPSNMLPDPPSPSAVPPGIQASVNANAESVEELGKAYETLGERLRLCEVVTLQPPAAPSRQSHSQPQPREQGSPERHVTLKDLSYLLRREFKVFGGQIGDNSSEISYNSLIRQINEGLKEGFSETEIVRGVLRIVKPGTFRDMLILKDELALSELQGFLQSHLGEKATTEIFQELMCAQQTEQESPQQFLYRMIGLKQKLIFQSKQANADISYDPRTIQEVFLHTVYQGLGVKYAALRQRLRPLISNNNVTDVEILSEVTKIISDENEHQRRLGQTPRLKSAQSAVIATKDTTAKDQQVSQTIKQLAAQVETLTKMVATFMEQKAVNSSPQRSQPPANQKKTYLCPKCTEQSLQECSHCFVCGESGHRAIGCLKRPQESGKRETVSVKGQPEISTESKSQPVNSSSVEASTPRPKYQSKQLRKQRGSCDKRMPPVQDSAGEQMRRKWNRDELEVAAMIEDMAADTRSCSSREDAMLPGG